MHAVLLKTCSAHMTGCSAVEALPLRQATERGAWPVSTPQLPLAQAHCTATRKSKSEHQPAHLRHAVLPHARKDQRVRREHVPVRWNGPAAHDQGHI